MWLLQQGREPWLSTRGLHAFGDHFNPVAGFYAFLYRLHPHPTTLLVAQALLLSFGAVPVYLIARRRLSPALAGLACLAYWLQPALLYLNLFDFHFAMLLVPVSLTAAWALEAGAPRTYAAALVALLCTTESAAFTVVFLAPVAARLRGRRWALGTLAAAGLGMGLAVASLRHYGQGQTQYLSLYSAYGHSGGEIVRNLLLRPFEMAAGLDAGRIPAYATALLAPVAGLALLSPLRLLPALPVVLGNVLAWRDQVSLAFHYQAAVLPFVVWAALAGAGSLHGVASRRLGERVTAAFTFMVLAFGLQQSVSRGPLAQPRSGLLQPAGWRQLLAALPPAEPVASDNNLGAHLSGRDRLYVFPNPFSAMAWGNSSRALVGTLSLTFPPAPGELRRGLEQGPADHIALYRDADAFPCPRSDRWYLLAGTLRSDLFELRHFDGQLLWLARGRKLLPPDKERVILKAFQP